MEEKIIDFEEMKKDTTKTKLKKKNKLKYMVKDFLPQSHLPGLSPGGY